MKVHTGAYLAAVVSSLAAGSDLGWDFLLGFGERSWSQLVLGALGVVLAALYFSRRVELMAVRPAPAPVVPEGGDLVVEAQTDSMRAMTAARPPGREPLLSDPVRNGIALDAFVLAAAIATGGLKGVFFCVVFGMFGLVLGSLPSGRRTPLP